MTKGLARAYPFTETEKDIWANLFEYKGSQENVRLKFAVDKIGATLDDIVILYEDSLNGGGVGKVHLKSQREGGRRGGRT